MTPKPETARRISTWPGASRSAIRAALSTSSSASRSAYAVGPSRRAACRATVLCQTLVRDSRRKRLEERRLEDAVGERATVHPELGVLRGDATGQHRVDAFVVPVASRHQRGVAEVIVRDHGQQCLGEVVVHVRVDAEQHVP